MYLIQRIITITCTLGLLHTAFANDTYPSKQINVTIPMAAGGTSDLIGRMITPALSEELGQSIIIENRAGANGAVGEEYFSHTKPDGYSLMLQSTSIVTNPWIYKQNYDPRKDFIPVTQIAAVPLVLVVNEKVPVNTAQEFISLVRKSPGKLSYSSWGNGSIGQFAGESLKLASKTNFLHVPYKSTSQALSDVLSGQVDAMFPTLPLAMQHTKSGKIKALAIFSPKRSPMAPNIPTTAEIGYPGLEAETWIAIFVPTNTPKPIIQKIYEATQKVLARPAIRAQLEEQGFRIIGNTPEEFSKYYFSEMERYGKIVKDANMKDGN